MSAPAVWHSGWRRSGRPPHLRSCRRGSASRRTGSSKSPDSWRVGRNEHADRHRIGSRRLGAEGNPQRLSYRALPSGARRRNLQQGCGRLCRLRRGGCRCRPRASGRPRNPPVRQRRRRLDGGQPHSGDSRRPLSRHLFCASGGRARRHERARYSAAGSSAASWRASWCTRF